MIAWTNRRNVVLLLIVLIIGLPCFVLSKAKANPYSEDNPHCKKHGEQCFTITGGFFTEGGNETLIVKKVGEDNSNWGELFEFYRKNDRIGKTEEYQSISYEGLCRSPDTSLLSLLFSGWMGGVSVPANLFYVKFDEQTGKVTSEEIFDAIDSWDPSEGDVVRCSGKSEKWREELSTGYCECTYSGYKKKDKFAYSLEELIPNKDDLKISEFPSTFLDNGKKFKFPRSSISKSSKKEFLKFLEHASKLPSESGLAVTRTESSAFVVGTVMYERNVYGSYQYIIVGKKRNYSDSANYDWTVIYSASLSSKGFYPARVKRFVSDSAIQVEMCVEDCDWHGRYKVVQIDLENNQAELVGDVHFPDGPDEETNSSNLLGSTAVLIDLFEFLGKLNHLAKAFGGSLDEKSATTKDVKMEEGNSNSR